jgi:hypothetical protein
LTANTLSIPIVRPGVGRGTGAEVGDGVGRPIRLVRLELIPWPHSVAQVQA